MGMNENMLLSYMTAVTGDNGKPLLVAICLIVSIVLMVVLIVLGKNNLNSEDEEESEADDFEDNGRQ